MKLIARAIFTNIFLCSYIYYIISLKICRQQLKVSKFEKKNLQTKYTKIHVCFAKHAKYIDKSTKKNYTGWERDQSRAE